ncbi:MAG: T9SS type A sorting domain-containing protein [Chitinophagaceae bacterium]
MKTRLHSFTGQLIVSRIHFLALVLVSLSMNLPAFAGSRTIYSTSTYIAADTNIVSGNQSSEFNLPLVLTAFSASLNDQTVSLSWTTGQEKELSHFVIERSTNGRDYSSVAMIFTGDYDNVKQHYTYKDVLRTQSAGVLYYRLRLVDMQGRYQNSNVEIVRNSKDANGIKLFAYPNPATEEVRIVIPVEWQNKTLNYGIYDSKGQLVKHATNSQCGSTEVINVRELGAGVYVVKASSANTTEATMRIVKQ